MPAIRIPISSSQLAELLAVEPEHLIAVEKRSRTEFVIVVEPDHADEQHDAAVEHG